MKTLLLMLAALPFETVADLVPSPEKVPLMQNQLQMKSRLDVQKKLPAKEIKPIEADQSKLVDHLSGKGASEGTKVASRKKEVPLSGKVHRCAKFSKLPRVIEGCEGEACGMLRYNKAIRSAKVYAEPKKGSSLVGEIKKCDLIEGFQSYLVIHEHGTAKVLKPTEEMKELGIGVGDIVPIVQSLSEGYLSSCVGQKEFLVNMGSSVDVQEFPQADSWARIRVASGKLGFAKEESRFYMGYHDYDPSEFCPGDKEA